MQAISDDIFSKRFPIDLESSKTYLNSLLSKGADYGDLYFEYGSTLSIQIEEGLVKDISRGDHLGVGARALSGEQIGYAHTNALDDGSLKSTCLTAAAIVHSSSTNSRSVALNKAISGHDLYAIQVPVIHSPLKKLIEWMREGEETALGFDSRIEKVSISLSASYKEFLLVTSEGIFCSDIQPMVRFYIMSIAKGSDGQRQRGHSGEGGRYGEEFLTHFDIHSIAEKASEQAITLLDAKDAPAGKMPVVLAPGNSGVLLHEAVGHGLEADFNRKQLSNYSNRIGQKVASELCTVVDDGTLPFSRGSINVDDEGNDSKKNVLIENGTLVKYMQDKLSSKIMGVEPTGNGRRESYAHIPVPRMTNTYLMPGKSSPEEILSSVDNGIYAKSLGGGQVNIANGDFVFEVTEAYKIEKGKLTYPLKGAMLIGNGPDTLSHVTMVGNDHAYANGTYTCGKDGQWVPVSMGVPTLKISEITVGGNQLS